MSREEHLTIDQMCRTLLEHEPLSDGDAEHLAGCAECRDKMAELENLTGELGIAYRSAPTSETIRRWVALFDQVQTSNQAPIGRAWSWAKALVTLDSRIDPLRAGVRNVSLRQYRLLFSAEAADIELLVMPDGGARRVEGDLMVADDAALGLPALIQLVRGDAAETLAEAETDLDGRFRLEAVPQGIYELLVTPAWGETIQVESLEIT